VNTNEGSFQKNRHVIFNCAILIQFTIHNSVELESQTNAQVKLQDQVTESKGSRIVEVVNNFGGQNLISSRSRTELQAQ
jgi:hypothetical protein